MKERFSIGIVAVLGVCPIAAAIAIGLGTGEDSATGAGSHAVPRVSIEPPPASGTAAVPEPPPASGTAATVSTRPRPPVPTVTNRPRFGRRYAILQVRKGARVPLYTSPGGRLVRALGGRSEFGSPVVLGVVRERGPWLGVTTPFRRNGRLGWVRVDPSKMALYWTRYWLRVRLSARVLELHYGGRLLGRYTVSIGAAGSETPRGRFSITDALKFGSNPYYGCCALALSGHQEQLPPGWLGGDRIAIHGTPGPVGYAASLGCVRATDRTMRTLFRRVPLGTPVFVRG